jgi:DNA-binding PucR family transcriptional regulator
VGAVLDYDAARGTELLATLEAYLACGGNHAQTAAALYIHVNTLYQRLDRITRLLGEGWRHGDTALQVHLACKLHKLGRADA